MLSPLTSRQAIRKTPPPIREVEVQRVVDEFAGGTQSVCAVAEVEGQLKFLKSQRPHSHVRCANFESEILAHDLFEVAGIRAPEAEVVRLKPGSALEERLGKVVLAMDYVDSEFAGRQKVMGGAWGTRQGANSDDYRKMILVDILMGNADRRGANYLDRWTRQGEVKPVPIDNNSGFGNLLNWKVPTNHCTFINSYGGAGSTPGIRQNGTIANILMDTTLHQELLDEPAEQQRTLELARELVGRLSDEKIDVIEWNSDPAIFIAKALSPARVSDMLLEEDFDSGRTATVIVPDDQLSLAIGREGQNARLAAKLTGWRIDIKSVSESVLNAFDRLDEPPLNTLHEEEPELVAEVTRIVEKKRANRPIPPEEFKTLTDFAKIAERKLLGVRDEARSERRSAMEVVRAVVPEHAFQMELDELELDEDIMRALGRVANVGELMMRMLSDEEGLRALLQQGGAGDDAMDAIRYALDDLVILQPPDDEVEAAVAEAEEAAAEEALEAEVAEVAEDEAGLAQSEPTSIFEEDAALPPAFVEPEAVQDEEVKPRHKEKAPRQPVMDDLQEPELDEIERRRHSKKKRRQLVYDEDRGEMVAKRRRKGSRQRGAWDDQE